MFGKTGSCVDAFFGLRRSAEKQIVVYFDEGTSAFARDSLLLAIRSACERKIHARPIFAAEICSSDDWHDGTVLFAMPGGADKPYCKLLNGTGNISIRRFIEKGGSYLGICAGAYYGAKKISFEAGSKSAIVEDRELALVPCCARGVIHELTVPFGLDESGRVRLECAALTNITRADGRLPPTSLLYWGGPYFEPDPEAVGWEVLAHYSDLKQSSIAIIKQKIGDGTVVLCGVHPEVTGAQYRAELDLYEAGGGQKYQGMAEHLNVHEQERDLFFRSLLEDANLGMCLRA